MDGLSLETHFPTMLLAGAFGRVNTLQIWTLGVVAITPATVVEARTIGTRARTGYVM